MTISLLSFPAFPLYAASDVCSLGVLAFQRYSRRVERDLAEIRSDVGDQIFIQRLAGDDGQLFLTYRKHRGNPQIQFVVIANDFLERLALANRLGELALVFVEEIRETSSPADFDSRC